MRRHFMKALLEWHRLYDALLETVEGLKLEVCRPYGVVALVLSVLMRSEKTGYAPWSSYPPTSQRGTCVAIIARS